MMTKLEKKAIEDVLDMGFVLTNSNGDEIKSVFGCFEINFHNGTCKEYDKFETALNKILKNH
jgi:hypothetical protein